MHWVPCLLRRSALSISCPGFHLPFPLGRASPNFVFHSLSCKDSCFCFWSMPGWLLFREMIARLGVRNKVITQTPEFPRWLSVQLPLGAINLVFSMPTATGKKTRLLGSNYAYQQMGIFLFRLVVNQCPCLRSDNSRGAQTGQTGTSEPQKASCLIPFHPLKGIC